MSDQTSSRFSPHMLNLAAYFIVPAVGVPMLWQLYQANARTFWIASGLLAVFTLVFFLRNRLFDRRTWGPYLYTTIEMLLIVALLALPPHQLIVVVLFFILSAEVTMMYPPRVVAVWISIFSLVTLVAYLAVDGPNGLMAVPIYVAGYIFFAAFAQQTAKAEAERVESERLLQELQTAHQQLQEYASQAEELAVQQERNRLAREMHDTLGHRLTVSSVQLQAAQRLIPSAPDRAAEIVATAQDEIREGLRDLRRPAAALRAPVEADLALGPALKRLAGSFEQATGITVHLTLPDDLPELAPNQRHALYRGAQEGLTNVQKHAEAREAWVELARRNGAVALTVRDSGVGLLGSAGDAQGFGLRGLRERASLLGGDLAMTTTPAGGAELLLMLPISGENAHG